jgi:hypothetical protein
MIYVSTYVEGAQFPNVITPCRTQEEAEALASRIRQQLKDRGWQKAQIVRIEHQTPSTKLERRNDKNLDSGRNDRNSTLAP